MRVLFRVTTEDNNITYHSCPVDNQHKLKELFEEFGAKVEIYSYPVALEILPEETQAKVKSILRAFNEVSVTYERGQFTVSTGIGVYAQYAYDHMVCGRYKQETIYTKEERRQNFIEEFGYAPCYL